MKSVDFLRLVLIAEFTRVSLIWLLSRPASSVKFDIDYMNLGISLIFLIIFLGFYWCFHVYFTNKGITVFLPRILIDIHLLCFSWPFKCNVGWELGSAVLIFAIFNWIFYLSCSFYCRWFPKLVLLEVLVDVKIHSSRSMLVIGMVYLDGLLKLIRIQNANILSLLVTASICAC
jgi:hypothetical protein